jgi:hypothetical protein
MTIELDLHFDVPGVAAGLLFGGPDGLMEFVALERAFVGGQVGEGLVRRIGGRVAFEVGAGQFVEVDLEFRTVEGAPSLKNSPTVLRQ